MAETDRPFTRRAPSQNRSRVRRQSILDATVDLLKRDGYDAVSVREIARTVGIPISSVYQYFPNKMSIARSLANHYMGQLGAILITGWQQLDKEGPTESLIRRGLDRIIDDYYRFYKSEPAMIALWSATQGVKELREMEINNTRNNAVFLQTLILEQVKQIPKERLEIICMMLVEVTGSNLRLAISLPEEQGRQVIDELKYLLLNHLQCLAQ